MYVANAFAEDWLERNYDDLISEAVKEITGKTFKIKYSSSDELNESPLRSSAESNYFQHDSLYSQLEKRIEQLEDRVRQLEERR